MIKFQNKKIQELQDEIDKRDQKLQALLSQVTTLEGYKFQMENFKRQTNVLEDKVKLYETDISAKADHLSEQLIILSESEGRLRNQVIAKDKVIMELENSLNDQDFIIGNLNKQLLERDDGNKMLKGETNELLSKFRTISKRMEMKEEEFRRHSLDKDDMIKELSSDKACLEDKLNQVIEIIKQYSKELNELNQKVNHYEFEYKAIKQLNERQNEEIEKLIKDNNALQNSLYKYKDINIKVDEAEKVIYEFETMLKNERLKYECLSRNNQEIMEKYQLLRDKVSGENNPDNLKSIIDERLVEINKLNFNIDGLTKASKQLEQTNRELDYENKELIGAINNDLISIIQWIETYLGNFYESSFNIPDINVSVSRTLRNKLKLDLLKETLMQTRKRVNGEYNKMLGLHNEQKRDISEYNHKIEILTNEVASLRLQVTQRDEDIKSYQQELGNYRISISTNKDNFTNLKQEINDKQDGFNRFLEKIYHSIKTELDKAYRNEHIKQLNSKDFKYTESLQNDIENNLDRLIYILNTLLNDYESILVQQDELKRLKPEYDRVKRELNERIKQHNIEMNRLTTEKDDHIQRILHEREQKIKVIEDNYQSAVNLLNNTLSGKEDFVLQLQQENILMKAQFDTKSQNIKTLANNKLNETIVMNDKLKDGYKDLETKYKSLITEIELKDRHIKSQEHMIYRRAQELQDIKRNEKSIISIADENKAKAWETEKDKLVKDNLTLMDNNIELTNQVNLLRLQLKMNDKGK